MQCHLDLGRAPTADQSRGDDARVVDHQQVARPQQLRQVEHGSIVKPLADLQQPRQRRAARGPLGDQAWRQVEIEFIDAHPIRIDRMRAVEKGRY